jgi:hypothetical protein
MTTLKYLIWCIIAVACLFAIPLLILRAMDATQAEHERSLQARADRCRVGQYCKIGGHGFLKMSEGRKVGEK